MIKSAMRIFACALWCLSVAAAAAAQDDPKFALLTSFPNPTVSVQYEINERFALRVETTYTYRDEATDRPSSSVSLGFGSNFDTTTSMELIESQTHAGSVGFAGIMTLHRTDGFRLYLAPRVAVTFSNQSATLTERVIRTRTGVTSPTGAAVTTITTGEPEILNDSSTSPGGGAALGASVNVHRRLALFGEAGFNYSRMGRSALLPVSITVRDGGDSEITTVSTRAVGGLMFRF